MTRLHPVLWPASSQERLPYHDASTPKTLARRAGDRHGKDAPPSGPPTSLAPRATIGSISSTQEEPPCPSNEPAKSPKPRPIPRSASGYANGPSNLRSLTFSV